MYCILYPWETELINLRLMRMGVWYLTPQLIHVNICGTDDLGHEYIVSRVHNFVLTSCMTSHRILNMSNTTWSHTWLLTLPLYMFILFGEGGGSGSVVHSLAFFVLFGLFIFFFCWPSYCLLLLLTVSEYRFCFKLYNNISDIS